MWMDFYLSETISSYNTSDKCSIYYIQAVSATEDVSEDAENGGLALEDGFMQNMVSKLISKSYHISVCATLVPQK